MRFFLRNTYVTAAIAVFYYSVALGIIDSSAAPFPAAKSLIAPTYVRQPPVLDGKMADGEWDHTARVLGFIRADDTLSNRRTQVWAAFDDQNLYFCFRCSSPRPVRGTQVSDDDAAVFHGDAVEIFLRPYGRGNHFQFGTNPSGGRFDGRVLDAGWDAEWESVSGIEQDTWFVATDWTVEFSIPFRAFGLDGAPADGTVWTGNFNRDVDSVDGPGRYTSWSRVKGDFHNAELFSTILFSRGLPSLGLDSIGDLSLGMVALSGSVSTPKEQDVELSWTVALPDGNSPPLGQGRQTIQATPQSSAFHFEGSVKTESASARIMTLVFSATAGGQTIHRAVIPSRILPPFRVEIASVYTKNFLQAEFDITRLKGIPKDAKGRVTLLGSGNRVVASADLPALGQTLKDAIRLQYDDAPPGNYTLRMELLDEGDNELATDTQPYRIPEMPEWVGNKLGINDTVPTPFEDVTVEGTDVSLWGRTYEFDDSIFPTRIVNQGVEQIARPIELVLETKGRRHAWKKASNRVSGAKATEVVLTYHTSCDAASIEGSVTVEYDGVAIFDFTVTPTDSPRIDSLRLEIPFRRSEASFLKVYGPIAPWAKEEMYIALIGDVPNDTNFEQAEIKDSYSRHWMPEGWTGKEDFFAYEVYVGNDERGFLVVQDTEENRFVSGSYFTLRYEGDVTIAEFHLIDTPTQIEKPLRYRLALAATPFKKYRHSVEYEVSCCAPWGGDWSVENESRILRRGSTLWTWGRMEKDYMATEESPDFLKKWTSRFRKEGVELLINSSNCFIPTPYEPFDTFKDEWLGEPGVTYANFDRRNGVDMVKISPQGSFADFYMWWLKRRIDQDGIGGLYFDLTGPVGNSNALSGGGWTDEQGVRHMTSDIFALRELYKRIYTLLKEEGEKRGTEFWLMQHSPEGLLAAFTDLTTKGEGYNVIRSWKPVTPNFFRAFSLKPLGPAFTLYPGASLPWFEDRAPHYSALARTLINGSLTTDIFPDQVAMDLFPIWKWRKEFAVGRAEFIPWYARDERIKTTPPSLYVSVWKRPGQAMVVASNLTDEPVEGTVSLDFPALGLPGGSVRAAEFHGMDEKDMRPGYARPDMKMSDHPGPTRFEFTGGRIPVSVRAQNYSLIRFPVE
jgi:hypothetical protein